MQHYTIHGGIENCAYSLVEGLNERGVMPVVLGRLNNPSEEENIHRAILERFGRRLRFEFQPVWIDRFRKGKRLRKMTQDPSPYLALQLPLLSLSFVFDFSLPLPLRVPRGRYVKYWNFQPEARGDSDQSRQRISGPLLDMLRGRAFERGYPIFLNSHFSADRAASFVGRRLPVLYPPVAIQRFWSTQDRPRRGIVSWGRFAPYKRQLELVNLAGRLARSGFEEPFTIMGGTESFPGYYRAVCDAAEALEVSNIRIVANPRFEQAVEVLRSAAIYVHMMIDEPFGITTAEAIAAGCVPLVHDSGGQREIVPVKELRWKTVEELAGAIRRMVTNSDALNHWRATCQEHVLQFAEARFQHTLLNFLERR